MGQNTPINYFSQQDLLAAIHPEKALLHQLPIVLPPSTSVAQGSLLIPPSGTGTSAQQTLAITGSPTGGTVTIVVTNPLTKLTATTATIPYTFGDSAVALAINNALANTGPGGVTVVSGLVTFTGALASLPTPLLALGTNALTGGTSPTMTVTNTTPGVDPGTWTVYSGSGSPTVILALTVTTDTYGAVALGTNSSGGPWQEHYPYVPCYYSGDFFCSDIPNLTTGAITAMYGRLINAQSISTPNAIVRFP